MPRVVDFEIYTDNPEAVRPFYEGVFDWKFQKFEGAPSSIGWSRRATRKSPGLMVD